MTIIQYTAIAVLGVWFSACAGFAFARASAIRLSFVGFKNDDEAGGDLHYRVIVKNISVKTVKKCVLSLLDSSPEIPNLPLPIHVMHQIRPSEPIDIAPGESRYFDLARIKVGGSPVLEIIGREWIPQVPSACSYKLLIEVVGEDVSPIMMRCLLEPEKTRLILREEIASA